MSNIEFYGPEIVSNSIESQKNQIIFKSRPTKIQEFGIDTYKKINLDKTNNIENFGNINTKKNSSHRLKSYKNFLKKNKNNFHNLHKQHLDNLVKFLHNQKIIDDDIPKSFNSISPNTPFYPSNFFN